MRSQKHTHTQSIWIFAEPKTNVWSHIHTCRQRAWDKCGCEMPWASLLDSYFIIIQPSISAVRLMMTKGAHSQQHTPEEVQLLSTADTGASGRTNTSSTNRGARVKTHDDAQLGPHVQGSTLTQSSALAGSCMCTHTCTAVNEVAVDRLQL